MMHKTKEEKMMNKMTRRLFGETEEKQFEYLKIRLISLGIGVIALLIGSLLNEFAISVGDIIGGIGGGICIVVLMMFGWAIMRGVLGIASIGALFSNNVVVGLIICLLFILVGYFGGMFVAVVGLCRFLVLLKKRKGNN